MTVLRTVLAAIVAATGLVLAAPAPAFACSCVAADAPQFVRWADVVVLGEVREITPPPESEQVGSADPVAYTVAADEVLKGDVGATVEVISARYGASCGLEGIEEGDDYVVFAAYQDIGGEPTDELWASLCGGTAPASDSYVAEVEAVTGPGHPPEPDESPAAVPESANSTSAPKSTADSAGIPVWAWAGGAAALLGIGGLLVARRRQSGA